MLDDEIYDEDRRQSQNSSVKRILNDHVKGDEIPSMALLLGLAQPIEKLVAKTPEQIAKIRASKKYIDATPEQRRLLIAPKRVGGGSTENQLVRRLFSTAPSAKNRVLLPKDVLGQSRLELGDMGDPFLYSRVVLAQCITGAMFYITDEKGEPREEEFRFGLLSSAVQAAEDLDSLITAGETDGIKSIRIEGVYLDWVMIVKRYLESK